MPAIATRSTSAAAEESTKSDQIRSDPVTTPQKRKLRSNSESSTPSAAEDGAICLPSTPNWKSPRLCGSLSSPRSPSPIGNELISGDEVARKCRSPVKRSSEALFGKSKWNPKDSEQMRAVKEALHVSTAPSSAVCREEEYSRVLEFCKSCVEKEKSGSLYVCGCPGTGKTMIMEKVKVSLAEWSKEGGFQQPDVLYMNCTSLTNPTEVFSKILKRVQPEKKIKALTEALKLIHNVYSMDGHSSPKRLLLLIVDELDYLITKDRTVLHELFMLTTLPSSRCILIGIANAIDLANRFLPRLESLNCKPMVLTFRAYSKDQILRILQDRLMVFNHTVFQLQALELCARKVAAASGDMRKALSVCRSAIEMLEAEGKQNPISQCLLAEDGTIERDVSVSCCSKQANMVQVDHMALALSKTFKSPIVETVQSLPLHPQIFLCSATKLFRGNKKLATAKELNKHYMDLCNSMQIKAVGFSELSSICRVLGDQGLLKVAPSHRIDRVGLKVDAADISFALQGVRFFRKCLS
ncbi:hypothetical protein Drorol1_Dr00004234 [Drosera rotundifolia]